MPSGLLRGDTLRPPAVHRPGIGPRTLTQSCKVAGLQPDASCRPVAAIRRRSPETGT